FALLRSPRMVANATLWFGITAIAAIAVCVPVWSATVGHMFRQLQVASGTELNWHTYFQCYLMSGDCRVSWSNVFDNPVRGVIEGYDNAVRMLAGAIGVYFLVPSSPSALSPTLGELVGGPTVLTFMFAATIATARTVKRPGFTFTRLCL